MKIYALGRVFRRRLDWIPRTVGNSQHWDVRLYRHPKFDLRGEKQLLFEEALNAVQDGGVHCRSDAAGLGILLTRVIDAKQARRSRHNFAFGAVSESEKCARSNHPALLQDFEVSVPSDSSQCQNRLGLQDFQLAFQILPAI